MKEILLSMKPDWYELCVSGTKIYEYRKNFPDDEIVAYIYVSSPEKVIKGIMHFGDRIALEEWKEKYKSRPAVKKRINNYMERNRYAVPIKSIDIIGPISLDDIKANVNGFIAPQMYYFLNEGTQLTEFIHKNTVNVKNIVVNDFSIEKVNEICRDYKVRRKAKVEQLSLFDFVEPTNDCGLTEEKLNAIHPKMVSLFSGCGGLDLGFHQAGYNIVYANDFDSDAQRVYEKNIGEIDKRSILEVSEDEVPECDILTGGFPCQPFSNAGNRKGVNDHRGNLYKECLRMIAAKMPKVVVFENVRGLLSIKDEDGGLLIDTIVQNLGDIGIGYNVTYQLVNASDYGVPQNRIRVVVVAFRKDLGKTFVFPPKQSKDGLNSGTLLDIPEYVPNQVVWEFSPQAMNLIQHIPEGGSWKSIPYEYLPERFRKIRDNMKRYHAPNMYRRFARTEIAGTITAAAQPENCGIIHPLENRRFNIREIARIQTFPDDFEFFTDSKTDVTGMYKVIGNAVPPTLAKVIANAIKKQLGTALID